MKFKIKANKYKYVIYDDFDYFNKGYWDNNGEVTSDIDEACLFDSLSQAISACEEQISIDLSYIEDDDRTERIYTIIQVIKENGQVEEVKTATTLRTGDYL